MADTIAALATNAAPAARAIVRVSGPASHGLAGQLTGQPSFAPASVTPVFITFATLQFPAQIYAFAGPRSYTGEDLVEFHLPGNPVLVRLFLDELHRRGARPADPGEFTSRAYFNGKIELTEAEGVAATIAAANQAELRGARQLLAGELARRLEPVMDSLSQTLALIEVGIDFSEEHVTFLAADEVLKRVRAAEQDLQQLLQQSRRFQAVAHEPRVVLAGRPNAGKSSLVNALAGHPRAIVSDQSGTTRDVLTTPVQLRRGQVQLADVAGLEDAASVPTQTARPEDLPKRLGSTPSHTSDTAIETTDALPSAKHQADIDRQMQERATRTIRQADWVVLVKDIADTRPAIHFDRDPDLIVLTKVDLLPTALDASKSPESIEWHDSNNSPESLIAIKPADSPEAVSVVTRYGLARLLDRLDTLCFGRPGGNATLTLNARHLAGITETVSVLARAELRVHENAAELVAADLREAVDILGAIVGIVTPDDVLGRVFSAFCIGK